MNLKLEMAVTMSLLLLGCSQSALLEPEEVTVSLVAANWDGVCKKNEKEKATEALILGYIANFAVKYIINGVTSEVKKEVEDKVKVYSGSVNAICNIVNNAESNEFTLKVNKLTIPLILKTGDFKYELSLNSSKPIDWRKILKENKWFKGKAALSVNWVTYTRNGEFIYKNTVFNGDIATIDLKIEQSVQGSNSRKIKYNISNNSIVGLRPPQDSDNKYSQRHEISFSLTVVDESLSAKAARELYKLLDDKGGDYANQLGTKLKDTLDIKED